MKTLLTFVLITLSASSFAVDKDFCKNLNETTNAGYEVASKHYSDKGVDELLEKHKEITLAYYAKVFPECF